MNRFLAECGIASRRKSEELIEQGRISVNGNVIIDLAFKVDTSVDEVAYDGEKIKTERKVYFLLNKPKGVITTTDDDKRRQTVVDLIKTNFKIFPVGRLDFNTTGVLLLTNDGELSNKLTHPKNKVPREYIATLDKPLKLEDQTQLGKNIILDKRKSHFIDIGLVKKTNLRVVRVVTEEGRNHFVKRMFNSVGYNVKQLHRSKYGNITVDGLAEGSYRKMSIEEIEKLI
ncbi:MAG: rRNA pseudouridine synthase [Melioribacteraceae bacterium]|nr:rRNA pseudouridine synthase [Melioribacteraceae bacterium]